MNQCPGCGYIVPGAWTECRRCGTPVAAVPVAAPAAQSASHNGYAIPPPPPSLAPLPAPAPFAPGFGAPDDALLPGVRPQPGPVPDTMLPYVDPLVVRAPDRSSRWTPKVIAIIAVAVVIVIAGVYSMIPKGGPAKQAPTILAADPPSAGIPTSLSAVVRIAAESARHTALSTVIEAAGTSGAQLSPAQLQSQQPDYQWINGDQISTTNTIISITSGPGIDVIAVAGTDKDICAFGRWSPTLGSDYVTMAHQPNCSATNAPTVGWSTLPGGSNQDLPGVDGT